ncbi:MAG: hypothetical protein M1817_005809 [Caeruleum heppii]|nr:MAG: hypothetical protein M1817_005809 [Caeruleum heppii]
MRVSEVTIFISTLVWAVRGDQASISLGPLSAYSATAKGAAPLSGTVLSLDAPSATGDTVPPDGIDAFLSPDLAKSLEETVRAKCGTIDAECHQHVGDILHRSTLRLQPRFIFSTPLMIGFGATVIISLIIPFFIHDEQPIPLSLHLPPPQLSQATAAASADAIALATGPDQPYVTVTSPSLPSQPTGEPPSITTALDTIDGHAVGDILITFPEDLARRTEGIIHLYENCQLLRKRVDGLGCVSSAANGIIVNARPGGPLHDLLLIKGPLPLITALEVVRAIDAAIAFAKASASELGIDNLEAKVIGTLAVLTAYNVIKVGVHLAANNVIPAASLRSSASDGPTSETCSTTSAIRCDVGCIMEGAIQACSTYCTQTTTGCGVQPTTTTTGFIEGKTGPQRIVGGPTASSTTDSSTTAAAPKPENTMLVIWHCPPVTGQPFYDFYVRKTGFEESLDNRCGQVVGDNLAPQHHVDDPKQGRIDKLRPEEVERQGPGRIEHFPGPGDCAYEENEVGQAQFSCKSGKQYRCDVPTSELKEKITPKDGQCEAGGPRVVRTLVMVCVW